MVKSILGPAQEQPRSFLHRSPHGTWGLTLSPQAGCLLWPDLKNSYDRLGFAESKGNADFQYFQPLLNQKSINSRQDSNIVWTCQILWQNKSPNLAEKRGLRWYHVGRSRCFYCLEEATLQARFSSEQPCCKSNKKLTGENFQVSLPIREQQIRNKKHFMWKHFQLWSLWENTDLHLSFSQVWCHPTCHVETDKDFLLNNPFANIWE